MATDHIRYDVLARDALRGVLRRVLTDAAEHGLPGEHHFFITFLSTAEGVKLVSTTNHDAIIEIDGKRLLWRDVLQLRREQKKAQARTQQLALFELKDDRRPVTERTASNRYREPSLFSAVSSISCKTFLGSDG